MLVKAWNIQTGLEFTLDGPKGRVLAMTFDNNDTLYAAAEVTNHTTVCDYLIKILHKFFLYLVK